MKKILFALLIAFTGLVTEAQSVFSVGPKIGYNSNTLTNNRDSISTNLNNSFQIGAFVRVGKKVYFQPEANYQVVKGTMNKSVGETILSQDIIIKTIKVPALIGVKLINRKVVNLRLMAGPAVTFLYNKKLDPKDMGSLWPIQSVDDLKNSIWSVQMGAGLDVFFMTLDVRYELGLDNMYNGSSDLKMRNNIFNVSLGVKLL